MRTRLGLSITPVALLAVAALAFASRGSDLFAGISDQIATTTTTVAQDDTGSSPAAATPVTIPDLALPDGDPATVALELLASAEHGDGTAPVDYVRDTYDNGGWPDTDGDCRNDRHEVLAEESLIEPVPSANGCYIDTGEWYDPYSGQTFTDASDVSIDHHVPLSNAHRSGAWAWDPATKAAFAADLTEPAALVAIGSGTNQSKGDKGPEAWRPELESAWCDYALAWIRVKTRWSLTYTPAEADALTDMLTTCTPGAGTTVWPGPPELIAVGLAATPIADAAPVTVDPATITGVGLVACDARTETVELANAADTVAFLDGWRLHDDGTNHSWPLDGLSIEPGGRLIIATGDTPTEGEGIVVWKRENIWNNDGDTAHLVDPAGTETTLACTR